MSKIKKIFGNRIKEIRKEENLSQEELGDRAGLHPSYIGGIERGERNLSIENIEKLALGLKVDIRELFPHIRHVENQSEKKRDKNFIVNSLNEMNTETLNFISLVIKNLKKIIKQNNPSE